MKMLVRIAVAVLVLLAFGCSRIEGQGDRKPAVPASGGVGALAGNVAHAVARDPKSGFANLPDRGDLVAYPGKVVRQDGAYTWYRTDLSEEHALRAIVDGRLRVTTPEGEILDFQYDRHVEHPSGDWTWIGHRPGHEGEQTILTFGDKAAFGSIAQDGKPPLRLTVRDGAGWLVETDPIKLAGITNAATRPQRPDYHIVPESKLPKNQSGQPRSAADAAMPVIAASGATTASATTAAATTVDLIIGYTSGFATANGGASGATTRINYLVDVANAAYVNSKISAQVRLVKTMQVGYTDSNSNDTALEQLSGYKSGTGPVTPNAAFDALREAREQYGADLVSLVRDFKEPEHGGCGIAFLLGGGLQGIGAGEGWDELAYSVVSDGIDQGTDGKNYYCLDETLAHEIGHNMGAAHDKATAKGDDGTLDNPDDYGAYTYSFGYKTGAIAGNFYTIMAYGDSGQTIYRIFSNPNSTFCGGRACGSGTEDNSRTLRQTIPVVANFRSAQTAAKKRVLLKQVDTNGDRRYDLLFFNHALGKVTIWFMSGSTRLAYSSSAASSALRLVDTGDFDGNGRTDLLFDDSSARVLIMALSTGSSYTQHTLANVYSTGTFPMGVADVNGDGKSDILLRSASTGRVTTWYMSGTTRISYNGYNVPAPWEFVGSGDLNGDRKQDLLWTNADRQLQLSTSIGTAFDTQMLPLAYQSTYDVAGLQDINGDGRSDILLPSVDGTRLVVWYMNGSTRIAYNSHAIDPAYMLVGKGDFDGNRFGDLVMSRRETRQIKLLQSSGVAFSTSLLAIVPQSGSLLMDVE